MKEGLPYWLSSGDLGGRSVLAMRKGDDILIYHEPNREHTKGRYSNADGELIVGPPGGLDESEFARS